MRLPRTWRTRKDPFEGVWCRVLGWLEEDPDASAVVLLERLQEAEPERFSRANPRTSQRSVRKWRGIMASKLVYAWSAGVARDTWDLSESALSMDGLRGDFSVTFLNEAMGIDKNA